MLSVVAMIACSGCRAADPPAPEPAIVHFGMRNGECETEFEGRRYAGREAAGALAPQFRRLAAEDRALLLNFRDLAVPYRCVGSVVFEAQRAGLRTFPMAEPDPPRS